MDETPVFEVVLERVVVRDYMEGVRFVVSNPEVYLPKGVSVVSNVTFRQVYVTVE